MDQTQDHGSGMHGSLMMVCQVVRTRLSRRSYTVYRFTLSYCTAVCQGV
jgi:hypothetical protein